MQILYTCLPSHELQIVRSIGMWLSPLSCDLNGLYFYDVTSFLAAWTNTQNTPFCYRVLKLWVVSQPFEVAGCFEWACNHCPEFCVVLFTKRYLAKRLCMERNYLTKLQEMLVQIQCEPSSQWWQTWTGELMEGTCLEPCGVCREDMRLHSEV